LGAHPTLPTNLLAPPIVKPGDPYYGDGSCQVEEEIPPSWQLEIQTGTAKDTTTEADNATWARRKKTRHNISPIASWRSTSASSSKSDRSKRTRCTLSESSAKGWISCSRRSRCSCACQMPDLQSAVHPSLQHTWSTRPGHRLKFPGFSFFLSNLVAESLV
jgi:hypothetical protein